MERAGIVKLRRNLAVALGNAAGMLAAEAIDGDEDPDASDDPRAARRAHVAWARQQLQTGRTRIAADRAARYDRDACPTLQPLRRRCCSRCRSSTIRTSRGPSCCSVSTTPTGAFGLVLNRPMTTDRQDRPPGRARGGDRAGNRGVDRRPRGAASAAGFSCSDPGLDENAVKVCDGVYLSDVRARAAARHRRSRPVARALIAGYAGWGPGQLDEEVAASAWLTGDIDLDIVFRHAAGRDVGARDSPPRRRAGQPAAGKRRPLTPRTAVRVQPRHGGHGPKPDGSDSSWTNMNAHVGLADAVDARAGFLPLLPAAERLAGAADRAQLETMTARFAPTDIGADLSTLPDNERQALGKLVAASRSDGRDFPAPGLGGQRGAADEARRGRAARRARRGFATS